MKQHLKFICWLFCSWYCLSATGQINFDYTEGKILIKGKVIDIDSKNGLANTAIILYNKSKGITTDAEGNFSMYVYPHDTLKVTIIGYIPKVIFIKDIAEQDRYEMRIALVRDFYQLKEVKIYPFHSKGEFEKAFVQGPEKTAFTGITPPKYKHIEKTKISNPVSLLYEKIKAKRRAANPDFKPTKD